MSSMEVSGYLRVYNRNISAKKLGPSLTGSDPQGMAENTPSIIQEKGLIYRNLTASAEESSLCIFFTASEPEITPVIA